MLDEIIELDKKYYMNTFGSRLPVCFTGGKGLKLFDGSGREYYDFLGGIAVNALGHNHSKFISALKNQLDKVIHTSSLYYIENQAKLAEKLVKNTFADKVFFCNSGAEANEGAFKLAKIYFHKKGLEKYEIITLDKSFHGRTLATVAATGQEKYQKPYKPLTPGFIQIEPNNYSAVENAVTDKTAAIMIELIQGESGVHPMDLEYVKKLRQLCDEKDIILIFDEVQTGMGRTGKLFAHQLYGVNPDIFTSAKALGGGIPIGAVCASDKIASAFEPGDHGTTFGGNPFASAAGLAVFDIFNDEGLVENADKIGKIFKNRLLDLQKKYGGKITEVRSAGLLIGIELNNKIAKDVFNKLFDDGFLTSLCGGNTIRIAPPLIITENDVELFVNELDNVLGGF
ncbi:MAG: aspartate aminotransferase family protein [Clostridia bacterium]|nr:aspartate aminotransferase family protein [Clostridia bacterium]MCI8980155.1 aspartate aminotransferase family protein [Clostridia bacterium]MCI9085791.1 aspartate aminotransferase family protein [Clostridia bacterium]